MKAERWKKIERIFNRALEHDNATRASFLREACTGDDELHHEVVSLLRYETAAARFIETPAIEGLADEIGQADDPLPEGYQIGPYTVVSLLGEGGMGEVYRARDRTLGREVAIKAIPASFALDLTRVRRLEREAQLLASLNHPNIAAIYGVEEALGMQFLILELVEGETLAERIRRGPIPVDEALGLALQIAEALEAAHAKNVIHRDLKPSNIRVTPDGKAKVLDFGLAKALADDGGEDPENRKAGVDEPRQEASASTNSLGDTQHGMILGTTAYMPPEQARGGKVDKTADFWAFGCVFYEMLTGKAVWQGESRSDLISAALSEEANFSLLPEGINPRISRLIATCLEKDADARFDDARGIREAIARLVPQRGRVDRSGTHSVAPAWTNWARAGVAISIPLIAAAAMLVRSRGSDRAGSNGSHISVCPHCGKRLGDDGYTDDQG